MILIGIIVGIFAAVYGGHSIGDGILHEQDKGIVPGLVLGVWAAWPFFHHAGVRRYNFLHPVPKEYTTTAKEAFSQIRHILNELVYNYGDRWKIVAADTNTRRVLAHLRYTDEHVKFESSGGGRIHTRTERVQRFIALEVNVKETTQNTCVVQLDFSPQVEGSNFFACDSIIAAITAAIEQALGSGKDVGDPLDTKLPAPPWWLLILSGLTLFFLFSDVMKVVFS